MDSKNPKAKPLPIAKMMVHHFLYFARGRVDELPGSCWSGAGFIGGRGEEHPFGRVLKPSSKSFRNRYGINNRNARGEAPAWSLTAMVMNHYKRPKSFYVRTKVHYTTEKRKSITPITIGKCSQLANGMAYDVPGGGKKGSNFVDKSDWTAPFNGRILMLSNHQHGGGKYHALSSRTCGREAGQGPRLPRPVQPRVQHDPPDPARAGADRHGLLRHGPGHPDREGRGAQARGGARQREPARGGHGVLRRVRGQGRVRQAVRQDAHRRHGTEPSQEVRPLRPTTNWWCRS